MTSYYKLAQAGQVLLNILTAPVSLEQAEPQAFPNN